jgi:hypothetical protein
MAQSVFLILFFSICPFFFFQNLTFNKDAIVACFSGLGLGTVKKLQYKFYNFFNDQDCRF